VTDDVALFGPTRPRSHGRVRRALDQDIRDARAADVDLSAAGVAALRVLADRIDQLEQAIALRQKPYDNVPLVGMVRQFGEDCDRIFAAVQRTVDPLTAALAEFMAADVGAGPQVGNPPGPLPE
jgi:hypothetical protein